jgi:ubiquinone/menaquinone biosynthesis C-methylase UbiE
MTVETGRLEPDAVRTMFDRIAPVYDVMNRAMTAGLDRRWRAETARAVVSPGDRVLDACCGTGDLAIAAQRAGGKVIGLDFSERMLQRARAKSDQVEWIHGDALALPFEDGSFDAATVGFGVRNLEDLEGGLRELRRVLRPGGRVGIPRSPGRAGCCGRSTSFGSTVSSLLPGNCCQAVRRTRICRRASAGFPERRNSPS